MNFVSVQTETSIVPLLGLVLRPFTDDMLRMIYSFRVMHAVGAEFKLTDLLAPTHQRTRRFLSAVINFAKYREDKFAKFEETDQEGNRLEEEQALAENENQNAMNDLMAMQAEVASEEPVMKELMSQLSGVMSESEALKKELEKAREHQAVLDKKLEDTKHQADRQAGRIAELDKTKLTLMRRVIPDPEKELKLLDDLRLRQQKEEELLTSAQKLRTERSARRDALEKASKAVRKAVGICEDISETLDHVKAEKRTIKECKSSIATDDSILRELDLNVQRVQTSLSSLKDRSAQAQTEQDKMNEEKTRQMNEAKQRKLKAETEHADVLGQLRGLDLEVAKLETEEMALTRGHTERTAAVTHTIHQLLNQMRTYQHNVFTTMRETMSAQQIEMTRQQAQQSAALSP